MIPDFQNFTPTQMKTLILEYQKERKPEQFSIILAKYDKYILYVMYELIREKFYLKKESQEDLYQTSILGFHKGIIAFKPHLNPELIMLVIKAYIKAEIKQTYKNREWEVFCAEPPTQSVEDARTGISARLFFDEVMESAQFTAAEKDLIRLRFSSEEPVEAIAKKYHTKPITIYKRMGRVLNKVRKKFNIAAENTSCFIF